MGFGQLPEDSDDLRVLLKRSVRNVQACTVHARLEELVKNLGIPGGRSYCGDDLRLTQFASAQGECLAN